jgi:16S rRNA (guanine(966)-N(2))-methyltransferase RsmD
MILRVTSGIRKGASLYCGQGLAVRPTTDKVKQSIFNIIQFSVAGRKVLDLFAGSGALGIESLSRNSDFCVFVDTNVEAVKKNTVQLGFGEKCEIVKNDYLYFLNNTQRRFSLVFLDPPYNKGYIDIVLEKLNEKNLLEDNAIIAAECDFNEEVKIPKCYDVRKETVYGRVKVIISDYRKPKRERALPVKLSR